LRGPIGVSPASSDPVTGEAGGTWLSHLQEIFVSMASACPIELTDLMRAELRRLVRAPTTAQSLVSRARIVLLAADGHTNAAIGELTGVCTDTARKWRARFARLGAEGLADARRSGRPPRFTPVQVARTKALACQLSAQSGLPLSRWSAPGLAQQMIDSGIVDSISASTVRGGWPPMPSSPGNISRGSSSPTRTSPSRPDGYWTCMRPRSR